MAGINAHGCQMEADSDSEEGWQDVDDDQIPTDCICLYCEGKLSSPEATFIHCREKHNFDIHAIHKEFKLDCFSYIKMINYIRTLAPDPSELLVRTPEGSPPWDSDEFMKPVLTDDGLLQFDIEDLSVDCSDGMMSLDSDYDAVSRLNDQIMAQDHKKLLQDLRAARDRASVAEDLLQLMTGDLNRMRSVAKEIMMTHVPVLPPTEKSIQHLREGEDDSYFDSYGHFSIHQDMLQDTVRTQSYRDAICSNPELFRDKVVLDVGCGTGILSMFAARSGARLVIGVEMSDIIYQAMDIVRENGFEDKIKLVKGRMEDVDIPVEKVDVIISEWMGYFLLFESMLDTVLWARDHYLADGGHILPDLCSLSVAAIDDLNMHQRNYGYWDDVYGFKMSCMRTAVQKEASVLGVGAETVISKPSVLKELDVCSCNTGDLDFTSSFTLTMQRDGKVTAIMGYFDIEFSRGLNKVKFSTSPEHKQTHWKQTVFLLDEPISVTKGEIVNGDLTCKKNYKDPRTLLIQLTLGEKKFKYAMR